MVSMGRTNTKQFFLRPINNCAKRISNVEFSSAGTIKHQKENVRNLSKIRSGLPEDWMNPHPCLKFSKKITTSPRSKIKLNTIYCIYLGPKIGTHALTCHRFSKKVNPISYDIILLCYGFSYLVKIYSFEFSFTELIQ